MGSRVIVVGGGPVGVVAAMECARRGLSVTVVEKSTDVYDLPRAIVMDDEIQRAVTLAGAGSSLASVTSPMAGAEFIDTSGNRIIGFEIPEGLTTGLGFPPVVRYYQPQLETFLRDVARRAGVRLRLGDEVVAVAQSDRGVTATLGSGETLNAGWLIAADGAASPIRKSLGIPFDSLGFDQDWLVVDVRLRDGVEPKLPRLTQQICDPARPTTFVPGHERFRRWEFQLQPGETRDEMTSPPRVWSLLAPWITGDDAELVRAVVYRFHATVAGSMRDRRVFIAGDAAHQMPPFLGQGLCSGVRDSVNLVWKLQMVESGHGGERLLDTYDAERRPHASGVVRHATDMGRLIDQLAGRGGGQSGLENAYGGQRPFPHLEHGMLVTGPVLVGRQMPDITLVDGNRFDSVAGDGFAVVIPPGWTGADGSLATWREVGAKVFTGEVPFADGAVVVRPDRYVASVSSDADGFESDTATLMEILR